MPRLAPHLLIVATAAARGGDAAYVEHAGYNCYGGHGATDLESPQGSACPGSPMSVTACEARCDATAGCEGVTVAQGSGAVNCYRRAAITLSACGTADAYDTYVRSAGPAPPTPPPTGLCAELSGTQCYGDDIRDEGAVSSAAACCALCEQTAGCGAWTYNAGVDQHCWVKRGCADQRSGAQYVSGAGPPEPTPPPPPSPDCSPELCQITVKTVVLAQGTYAINRQINIPQGTTITGAGPGKTTIKVKPAADGKKRAPRFILGPDTQIGGFTFIGGDTDRTYFGSPVETPGCLTGPGGEDICTQGDCTGESGSCGGVRNALVHDIEIASNTATNAAWVAITGAGQPVSQNVTFRDITVDTLWADGANVHGGHEDVTLQRFTIHNPNDDGMAIWNGKGPATGDGVVTAGADGKPKQTRNIRFLDNTVTNPMYKSKADHGTTCYALFGGGAGAEFRNNKCAQQSVSFLRIAVSTSMEPAVAQDGATVLLQGNSVLASSGQLCQPGSCPVVTTWDSWGVKDGARKLPCASDPCAMRDQAAAAVTFAYAGGEWAAET